MNRQTLSKFLKITVYIFTTTGNGTIYLFTKKPERRFPFHDIRKRLVLKEIPQN
jgi:predicted GIY-YIG superfamily endonuclease